LAERQHEADHQQRQDDQHQRVVPHYGEHLSRNRWCEKAAKARRKSRKKKMAALDLLLKVGSELRREPTEPPGAAYVQEGMELLLTLCCCACVQSPSKEFINTLFQTAYSYRDRAGEEEDL
jgi:hypothetical protein